MKPLQLIRHPFLLQLMRFGMTGSLAAIVHFSVVVMLVEFFKLDPLYANVFGFLCAFMVSFLGHRYWTFAKTSRRNHSSLPLFFLFAACNFVLNQGLFYVLLRKYNLAYPIALLIVLVVIAIWTFLISKLWIFRE